MLGILHSIQNVKCFCLKSKIKKKNCRPWDIPLPPKTNPQTMPYCTSFYDGVKYFNSLKNFTDAMMDLKLRSQCSEVCPSNCEEIEYSYQMDTTALDTERLCSEEDTRFVRRKISLKILTISCSSTHF